MDAQSPLIQQFFLIINILAESQRFDGVVAAYREK